MEITTYFNDNTYLILPITYKIQDIMQIESASEKIKNFM